MKRLLVLFAFLVSASVMLYSQGVQITGTVTDAENGEALPGVSVVVKGTTIGAVTDFEGNYSISVPSSDELLVFSFVGMESQTINVGNSTTIDVLLTVDAIKMDEVVVIGYGTSTREANTGAVTMNARRATAKNIVKSMLIATAAMTLLSDPAQATLILGTVSDPGGLDLRRGSRGQRGFL